MLGLRLVVSFPPPSLHPQMSQNSVRRGGRHLHRRTADRPFYCALARGAKSLIHLHCIPANGSAEVRSFVGEQVKLPKTNMHAFVTFLRGAFWYD